MSAPRGRAGLRRALALAALSVCVAVASCSAGTTAAGPTDTASAVADTSPLSFHGCDQVQCEGRISGARYQILLPRTWNGTLLLYSHGYRFARPVPPTFAEPSTDPVPAPGKEVADALLADGYALAGSASSSNGWAVAEGVTSAEQLHQFFVDHVGAPRRTYLWGDSLGGLVTQVLAEKGEPWVSGAAPLCGVLGGTRENLDVAMDVAYAVRELLVPSLKLSGYVSHEEAVQQWEAAQRRILSSAVATPDGAARVALVAALVDAPSQTSRFDGSTPVSRISAAVEAVLTGLGYGTYGRYEIEQRLGGDPSQVGDDLDARVSDSERQLVDLAGGPGTTDRLLAEVTDGPRPQPNVQARAAIARLGEPTGELRVPTVTLHTAADPLVLVQNESLFADRVRAANRQGRLLQLYVTPPRTFSAPAPYGAGHCNFTAQQRLSAVELLDGWVRTGQRPSTARVRSVVVRAPGIDLGYLPPDWPTGMP
jgi:hypothetical protein